MSMNTAYGLIAGAGIMFGALGIIAGTARPYRHSDPMRDHGYDLGLIIAGILAIICGNIIAAMLIAEAAAA
jgi:hypothetical protein